MAGGRALFCIYHEAPANSRTMFLYLVFGVILTAIVSLQESKPHRQIALSQVLDAFEFEYEGGGEGLEGGGGAHVFKVVTTKRALVLSAPSEEEEIRWVSAVRALLARRGERDGA